jgi:hypothetical protein
MAILSNTFLLDITLSDQGSFTFIHFCHSSGLNY